MDSLRKGGWDLKETLAWIITRDEKFVQRASARRRFGEEPDPQDLYELTVILPDDSSLKFEIDRRAFTSEELLAAIFRGNGKYRRVEDAVGELIQKALAGDLDVLGLEKWEGMYKPIPKEHWAGLAVNIDGIAQATSPQLRPGAIDWYELRFYREQVMKIWPADWSDRQVEPAPTEDKAAKDNIEETRQAENRGNAKGTDAPSELSRYSPAKLEKWYLNYIEEQKDAGHISTRDEDWEAAKHALRCPVPRDAVRELRRKHAPGAWIKPGRRKSS